jgi:hypothetical protein
MGIDSNFGFMKSFFRLVFFLLIFFLLTCSIGYGQPSPGSETCNRPSDAQATPRTVLLYRNLQVLINKGCLFGHQDDLAYGYGWKYVPGRSDIRDVTGDYPALYGWELGGLELDSSRNLDGVPFDLMREYIRQGFERGGVITMSWHLRNPYTGKTAWNPEQGTVAAILPGGSANARYKGWLDRVAAYVQSLTDNHGRPIPVILRLFHELNGNWFWWGGKNCTPEELKQLWRFTVGYLRDEKHVHNLLFAYNTDRVKSASDYLERYPGDQWVDVMGFDIYQGYDIRQDERFAGELDRTLSMLDSVATVRRKLPALTEFGFNQLPDTGWWTRIFLPTIARHRVSYALAWRNAGTKYDGSSEYYVPYPGQLTADDFKEMYKNRAGKLLFQKDLAKERIYEKPVK